MAEDRVGPGNEVDAGVDHGRGVDQGGDRSGAFHSVGQPDVEGELGALADGAAQEQRRDGDLPRMGHGAELREDFLHVERADLGPDGHDPEREAHVADSVDQERLLGGDGGAAARIPEADQQVAAQPDQLPAGEHEEEVVRQHQQQHREHEQVQVGEEAPAPRVVLHVAERVEVDEHPDRGDNQQQARGQRVDEQPHVGGEADGGDPAPERYAGAVVAETEAVRKSGRGHHHGHEPRSHDPRNREPMRFAREAPPEQPRRGEPEQREQQDQRREIDHWDIESYSSTRGVRRFR